MATDTRPSNPPGEHSQPTDPILGVIIDGRYRIDSLAGSGGMARVYQGIHTRTGAKLAIKIVQIPPVGGKDLKARCLNEARATMDIQSNNVVRAFDVGSLPTGQLYIAMEYLVGTDLDALVSRHGPLPWIRVAYVAIQICSGLAAAHRLGIIHRDIKPQNCFHIAIEGQDDQIKIIDFGVARDSTNAAGLTQEGFLLGTPEYTAPELITGQSKANERTDIYALGATLYKLLTGTVPFRGQDAHETLRKHVQEPLTPPSVRSPHLAIPQIADEIIGKALAKDPRDRFSSADELASSICAALNIQRTGLTLRIPPIPPDSPESNTVGEHKSRPPSGSITKRPHAAAPPPAAKQTKPKPSAASGIVNDSVPPPAPIAPKHLLLRGATLLSLSLSFATGTWLVSPTEPSSAPSSGSAITSPQALGPLVPGSEPVPTPEPDMEPDPSAFEQPIPPNSPPASDPVLVAQPTSPPVQANPPVTEPQAIEPPVLEPPVIEPTEAPRMPAPTQPERNFGYEDAKKLIEDEHTYLRNECMAKGKPPAQQVKFRVDVRSNGTPKIKVFSSDNHVRQCVKGLLRFPFDPSPRGGAFKYTLTTTTGDLQRLPIDPAAFK